MSKIVSSLFIIFSAIFFQCTSQNDYFICNDTYEVIFEEHDYNNLNQKWLMNTFEEYKKIEQMCLLKPNEMEKLILIYDVQPESLGNGYSIIDGNHGTGYSMYYYQFIYKNDSLISYQLKLTKKSVYFLNNFGFQPTKIFKPTPGFYTKYDDFLFYYNYDEASRPYKTVEFKDDISEEMKFYMTPYSGITYGCRGGYGNGVLENRCAFKRLVYNKKLTANDLIYIMHSINIASRLTAVEYYQRNKKEFGFNEQNELETEIKKLLHDLNGEKIDVLFDDIGFKISAEESIRIQLEQDCW